jgi:hypothetical protein
MSLLYTGGLVGEKPSARDFEWGDAIGEGAYSRVQPPPPSDPSPPRTNRTRISPPRTNRTRISPPRTNRTRISPPRTNRTRISPSRTNRAHISPHTNSTGPVQPPFRALSEGGRGQRRKRNNLRIRFAFEMCKRVWVRVWVATVGHAVGGRVGTGGGFRAATWCDSRIGCV